MFEITAPGGETIEIPGTREEDRDYFTPAQVGDALAYYRAEGYVVVRGLIPPDLCEAAMAAFAEEVKPYKGHIYRQTTARPEKNVFTPEGFVLNPVLNLQDLDRAMLGKVRRAAMSILTHTAVQDVLQAVFDGAPKLVQSMYFEGNSATWPHQDTYYLDSERVGTMIAGWFALEDIRPGAGRFFVYPKSQLIDMAKNGGDFDIAFHHDRYKELITELVRGMECRAPFLAQGDVLFWNAKTIHGSLETRQPQFSRSSLTAHYIPECTRLLQFQSRLRPERLKRMNGMTVHAPKDQKALRNRAILFVESSFPGTFQTVKRLAIKAHTR